MAEEQLEMKEFDAGTPWGQDPNWRKKCYKCHSMEEMIDRLDEARKLDRRIYEKDLKELRDHLEIIKTELEYYKGLWALGRRPDQDDIPF